MPAGRSSAADPHLPVPRAPWLVQAGICCGIVAPLWWGAAIAYCGSRIPGFDHATQFISEIAARGSPAAALMREAGFMSTGALYLVFAATVAWQFRAHWRALLGALLIALAGIARIGAGIYACEPGCDPTILSSAQEWHYRYASAGYGLMMLAAVVVGFAVQRMTGLRHLLAWGIGTAVWSAVFLFFMETSTAWQGLFQRLASGLLSLWVLVFAGSLWRLRSWPIPDIAVTAVPEVPTRGRRQVRGRR